MPPDDQGTTARGALTSSPPNRSRRANSKARGPLAAVIIIHISIFPSSINEWNSLPLQPPKAKGRDIAFGLSAHRPSRHLLSFFQQPNPSRGVVLTLLVPVRPQNGSSKPRLLIIPHHHERASMASPSNDVGASSSHTSPPAPAPAAVTATGTILLPRVTIQFCTQCKWLLRAAYVRCFSFLVLSVPRQTYTTSPLFRVAFSFSRFPNSSAPAPRSPLLLRPPGPLQCPPPAPRPHAHPPFTPAPLLPPPIYTTLPPPSIPPSPIYTPLL